MKRRKPTNDHWSDSSSCCNIGSCSRLSDHLMATTKEISDEPLPKSGHPSNVSSPFHLISSFYNFSKCKNLFFSIFALFNLFRCKKTFLLFFFFRRRCSSSEFEQSIKRQMRLQSKGTSWWLRNLNKKDVNCVLVFNRLLDWVATVASAWPQPAMNEALIIIGHSFLLYYKYLSTWTTFLSHDSNLSNVLEIEKS